MHAIDILDDDKRTLVWRETERPEPAAGQVRVRVVATAVNRADLLQRRGLYPVPAGSSPILGLEAAGVIDAVGAGVSPARRGERVCVLLEGGGYAEWVVVDEGMLLTVPDAISLIEAAALPEAIYTVWTNIGYEANIRRGETLLVNAAGSGIGTCAVQVGKALGCRVLATASASKLETVSALGADAVRDRNAGELAAWVRSQTDGRGADVVLDMVGGEQLGAHVDALAPGGRLVLIGLMGGAKAQISLQRLLMFRQRIIGSVLRSRPRNEKLDLTRGVLDHVWPAVADGRVRAIVDRVLPIDRASEAHALLESNSTVGKVVLQVSTEK